jgi:hypothetical protein
MESGQVRQDPIPLAQSRYLLLRGHLLTSDLWLSNLIRQLSSQQTKALPFI